MQVPRDEQLGAFRIDVRQLPSRHLVEDEVRGLDCFSRIGFDCRLKPAAAR